MKLIVGLGNPGKEYEKTKHNIGFMTMDLLAGKMRSEEFLKEDKFKSELTCFELDGEKVFLVKPQTFMNLSGEAVQKIASFYKIEPKDIAVVHDELDLPSGEIKVSFGRGSAGHNGVKSIIQKLGTEEFLRVRIGIGKNRNILKKIGLFDRSKINKAIERSVDALLVWLRDGAEAAMQEANRK